VANIKDLFAREKEYSIIMGGTAVKIRLKTDSNGKISIVNNEFLDEKMRNLDIKEKLLQKIVSSKNSTLNLDSKLFLFDKENSEFRKKWRKTLDNNMENIVDALAKNKEKLGWLMDNGEIRSNGTMAKAKNYYSVPEGFIGKALYSTRKAIAALNEISKGVAYVEPKGLREFKKSENGLAGEGEKSGNGGGRKEQELVNSQIMQSIEDLIGLVAELQKKIITMESQKVAQTSTEVPVNVKKKVAPEVKENVVGKTDVKTSQKQQQESAPRKVVYTAMQSKVFNEIKTAHEGFKTVMVKEGGLTKQDYEGDFGINTIKKRAWQAVKDTSDVGELNRIKDAFLNDITSSFDRAIENKRSKQDDMVAVSGNETVEMAKKIAEKAGGNIAILPEDRNSNVDALASGHSLADISEYANVDTSESQMDGIDIDEYIEETEESLYPTEKTSGYKEP